MEMSCVGALQIEKSARIDKVRSGDCLQILKIQRLDSELTVFQYIGQYLDVAVGVKEVCALHHNNTIDCWGAMQGVVPYNQTAEYHQISMGIDHACAVKLDGHVICFHNGPNYNLHEAPLGMALEF